MTERERYRRTDRTQDVVFVFGALSATHLPGPPLVRILGELGLNESAARNTLTKMVRQRALVAEPAGRLRVYSLPTGVQEKYRQIEGTAPSDPWAGEFSAIIHRVPESERWFRDRLQYFAPYFGYGMLRPGVLVAARDRAAELIGHLEQAPDGVDMHACALRPSSAAECRAMAASAWDLAGIARQYAQVGRQITGALRDHPSVPDDDAGRWDAFRTWNDVYRGVIELQMRDPHLPSELLPPSWPRGDYMAGLGELNGRWGPTLQAFLREQVSAHGETADELAVYVPPAF